MFQLKVTEYQENQLRDCMYCAFIWMTDCLKRTRFTGFKKKKKYFPKKKDVFS